MQSTGNLYLIPTTLGDNAPLEVLPISVKKAIEHIDYYIVEQEKTARRFIKKISPGKTQGKLNIETLNKYTDVSEIQNYLTPCLEGKDVGLISEAGCPGVADPGADVVKLAHSKNIKVVPMVGPSSILMAMMASGMNGQNFAFTGYLPIDKTERKKEIKKLEKRSRELNQSQLFIETPYRNDKLLADLATTLHPNTQLCVAANITMPDEYIKTQSVAEWKHTKVDLHKIPTLFIIHST
jgi:16S rRNA (cytidine1402-2'-O)-methyltransferase